MRSIGLFGGTFDPIHHGHLRLAIEVLEAMQFDELRMIPLYLSPHAKLICANPMQRLAMLQLALEGTPQCFADDREIRRASVSYTIDTLLDVRSTVNAETRLSLIMGMDAFNSLETWHRWEELNHLANFIVVHRPGAQPSPEGRVAELLQKRICLEKNLFLQKPAGNIYFQLVSQLDISSTHIRNLIRKGSNPRFLLPDNVLDYINRHHLYRV